MSSTHPRRTTKTTSSAMTLAPSSLAVNSTMSLRKGSTFHCPSSPDSHFVVPSLPRRSQTTLEDVVEAHERRVAMTLASIDRGLSAVDLDTDRPTTQAFRDNSLPVPRGFLNHTVATRPDSSDSNMSAIDESTDYNVGGRSLRPRRHARRTSNHHASDSGLGSSIMSMSEKGLTGLGSLTDDHCAKSIVAASAITRSAAADPSTLESLPRLSERASNKIHEHILKPLLAKPSLKDFHPIVEDCPRRIHEKEIVCLRDLEKTLIFMAPERSKSIKLYLDFCLTSIRCIQATVEFLHEREQTRPSDRPYTNGYFVDLVDQIRNYARSVQATQEKEANGETVDEMDAEATDEVKLYGGVAKTGRPAELVRVKKNGKIVSLSTGEPIETTAFEEDQKSGVLMKRSLSQEAEDEEDIMRSMARRKRSASAAELAPKKCSHPGCNKEFKRPCDLTKHEKTHSRPFKCSEPTCKYHEYGWPTEKELDRHVNDKHAASPILYKCYFKPCPYQSKRESNCKQHMEKSHGWTYVRSKNNGKNKNKSAESALPTPQTTTIQTPETIAHDEPTPPEDEDYDMETYDGATGFDNNMYPQLDFPEYSNDGFMYDPNAMMGQFGISPVDSNLNQSLDSSAQTSPFISTGNTAFQMDDVQANFGPSFGTGNDFNLYDDDDIYNARVIIPQLPTPDQTVFRQIQTNYVPAPAFQADVPKLSPTGHGNTMLYTPSLSAVDESYDPMHGDGKDFQLFSNHTMASNAGPAPALFGELPSSAATFSQTATQEFFANFYATNTNPNTNGDWTHQDEGFSSY